MSVPLSNRLYYCACRYLSYVLVAEALLEEQEDTTMYSERILYWDNWLYDLADWLGNEKDFMYIRYHNRDQMSTTLQQHETSVFRHWSDYLERMAHTWATQVPEISGGTWLYYLYNAWQGHCLQAFDTLLHTSVFQDTSWLQRYQAQRPLFEQIITLRQAEKLNGEVLPVTQHTKVLTILTDMEHAAQMLAQEWRKVVEEISTAAFWEAIKVGPPTPRSLASPHPDDDIPY